MPSFRASNAFPLVNITAMFAGLNRLDDLWTLYLKEPGQVPIEDIESLTQITDRMRDILNNRIRDAAQYLQKIIEQRSGDFDKAFQYTLAATPLDDNQRRSVMGIVERNGGFAHFAYNQLGVIIEEANERPRFLNTR